MNEFMYVFYTHTQTHTHKKQYIASEQYNNHTCVGVCLHKWQFYTVVNISSANLIILYHKLLARENMFNKCASLYQCTQ